MASADESDAAHYFLLSGTIERFLKDPTTAPALPSAPSAPPGAPIGLVPQELLGSLNCLSLNAYSLFNYVDTLVCVCPGNLLLSPFRQHVSLREEDEAVVLALGSVRFHVPEIVDRDAGIEEEWVVEREERCLPGCGLTHDSQ